MNATLLNFSDEARDQAQTGSASVPSQEFIERIESRLALLNEQIMSLSALAAKATEEAVQEKYWSAAREVSRDAREVRKYLATIRQP